MATPAPLSRSPTKPLRPTRGATCRGCPERVGRQLAHQTLSGAHRRQGSSGQAPWSSIKHHARPVAPGVGADVSGRQPVARRSAHGVGAVRHAARPPATSPPPRPGVGAYTSGGRGRRRRRRRAAGPGRTGNSSRHRGKSSLRIVGMAPPFRGMTAPLPRPFQRTHVTICIDHQ
jgi:hypothetical protein